MNIFKTEKLLYVKWLWERRSEACPLITHIVLYRMFPIMSGLSNKVWPSLARRRVNTLWIARYCKGHSTHISLRPGSRSPRFIDSPSIESKLVMGVAQHSRAWRIGADTAGCRRAYRWKAATRRKHGQTRR